MDITSYWGHVTDFNYYRNHAYPLKSPGVGATCDYMLLSDGDLIEVGFFGDPTAWTRAAFTMFDEDSYEIEAGDVLLFTAAKRSTNENYSNQAEPTTEIDAYLYDSDWNCVAQAELEDGIYFIDVPETLPGGQYTLMGQDPAGAMYPATAQVTVIGQEAPPEDPVDITVRVSVSSCGLIEEDQDGEPMALRDVALTGKAHYTLDDVFRAAHDLYYAGGAAAGYASYETAWGTSVAAFWGDESGNIAYQINKGTVNVMNADDEVHDGDVIDAYILQSAYPDTEAYAVFDRSDIDAESMDPFDLTLTQAFYDENFNMVFVPCANAVITVDGEESDYVTDENGAVSIAIKENGTHLISAVKTKSVNGQEVTAITAPVALVTVTGQIPDPPQPQTELQRISGTTRYQTGLAIADCLKEYAGIEQFENICVTTGTNFADATSGTYLAICKNAPIILIGDSNGKTMLNLVRAYMQEDLAPGGTLYVLGGEGAVKEEWIAGLTDEAHIKRISGSTRYLTNLAILREAGFTGGEILVATGENYPDSLSASSSGLPILLVKDKLTKSQKAFLADLTGLKFTILGGKNAVSEDIVSELAQYGTVTERLEGFTRYYTSTLLSEHFFPAASCVVLATGEDFPDALAGGVLAYRMGAPVVLTPAGKTDIAAKYVGGLDEQTGVILGGTLCITDEDVQAVFGLE